MPTIKSIRGTRDLLPPETALWNFVEAAVRDVFRVYNFHEIRTPIIEDLQLFQRSVGEETDIVQKEMFVLPERREGLPGIRLPQSSASGTQQPADEGLAGITQPPHPDPSVRMLALRPENTAGVVRAYIEHKLWERPGLQRLYYIGPQFRRERPQKGRYRQFYQIGAEVIGPPSAGSEAPSVDAEVLEMLTVLLERVGITGWTLELNSVGCEHDRPVYNKALRDALANVIDSMCSDCQRRAVTNPLRVFDCKVPADQPILARLPKILDYLDESCRTHFAKVREILDSLAIAYTITPTLVRGLDYYRKTAFEFTHGALGAQNAILGGGRYDGLSENLGGPPAPGIGFAIGEDRFVMALSQNGENISKPVDVYIAPLGAGMDREAARLGRELRRHDISVELGNETFRLKKSLETASKIGARFAIILGENETKSGQFALKNLASGDQISVERAELAKWIRS